MLTFFTAKLGKTSKSKRKEKPFMYYKKLCVLGALAVSIGALNK